MQTRKSDGERDRAATVVQLQRPEAGSASCLRDPKRMCFPDPYLAMNIDFKETS